MFQVVYSKTVETEKDNKEAGHRLCETYMVLGEVSLENENYPQVILASIFVTSCSPPAIAIALSHNIS